MQGIHSHAIARSLVHYMEIEVDGVTLAVFQITHQPVSYTHLDVYKRQKEGNLLELAVEAAHVRATLGEISYACEKVVGRYKAVIRTISGVYSSESKNDSEV